MCEQEKLFKLHCQPAFNSLESSLTKICDILEGNGQPGLKVKIAILEQRVEILLQWRKWSIGIATIIAGGVCIKFTWMITTNIISLFSK